MERTQVYKVLDGERDYQIFHVSPNMNHQGTPSVAEELVMMEHYLNIAREKWVNTSGDVACLDALRKVAAIAIRCFENHGCPSRELPENPLKAKNLVTLYEILETKNL